MVDYGQSSETFVGSDRWGFLIPIIASIAGSIASKKLAQRNQSSEQASSAARAQLESYTTGVATGSRRLDNAKAADKVINHQPVRVQWGGPGSGLRGEIPHYTGGNNNPNLYSEGTKKLARDLIEEELRRGPAPKPEGVGPQKSSWVDKLLGGIAVGSSAVAAGRGARNSRIPLPTAGQASTSGVPGLPIYERFR